MMNLSWVKDAATFAAILRAHGRVWTADDFAHTLDWLGGLLGEMTPGNHAGVLGEAIERAVAPPPLPLLLTTDLVTTQRSLGRLLAFWLLGGPTVQKVLDATPPVVDPTALPRWFIGYGFVAMAKVLKIPMDPSTPRYWEAFVDRCVQEGESLAPDAPWTAVLDGPFAQASELHRAVWRLTVEETRARYERNVLATMAVEAETSGRSKGKQRL